MDSDKQKNAVAKPSVTSGGSIAALVPESLDDAFRLAKALSQSGDMVPAHYQGRPEATMAAIIRGMEVGLAPMQALGSIAVIHGRASLWGDAIPALLQKAGHHVDVEVEGEGDEMVATAVLTRGDNGKSVKRSFSMKEAKLAGLLNKKSPWQTYPRRMLMMRARSWAVRDGAADALMGLQIADEVQDYDMRDVTPRAQPPAPTGGFASMAQEARASAAGKPSDQVEDAEEVVPAPEEGEALSDELEKALGADHVDPEPDIFSEAYGAGCAAARNGKTRGSCPVNEGAEFMRDWFAGFDFTKESEAAS